ncbi:hypothetical protein [Desulfoscipio gibsoniae]|uniref:Uncharacterized protein n=1 Tax=Desulfoscipio gibsoniae DSM 7213 TaxID=767817 RepID=R4KNW9_9FIRM|nr:hypothetical protein [Desulfoscipio gibsoniae]AGL01326.1 hypothetical protein Desgi_1878 [Desulfoscipio gibsoniae DSM 7213]
MRWQGFKVHVVAISMLVALAAFLGAQWLYTSLNFQQPLMKELDNNQMITDYQIKDDANVLTIKITLRDTNDLMHTYHQINDQVQAIMGERSYAIELVDRRNDRLNEVYNQGQFAIHEAIAMGNFTAMADSLNKYARGAGLGSKVYIDSDYIYWQMKDGDYYLHAVFERGKRPGSVSLGTGSERGVSGA